MVAMKNDLMNTSMTKEVTIAKVHSARRDEVLDVVAVEEPLEIQLQNPGEQPETVSITMRTPGDDLALAAGFLWGEGVITSPEQIDIARSYIVRVTNQVCVALKAESKADINRLHRNFYTTSSCGVCGKTSMDLIQQKSQFTIRPDTPIYSAAKIESLSELVRNKQAAFEQTGGLHAAALFDINGAMLNLREDVGRHNAVDKVIGKRVIENQLPLSETLLFLSGRVSFELVQKASMAGVPVIAAVSAPSSLAVEFAQSVGITLIGFLRDGRFNIYSGHQRISQE